jgi:hypothetical protein
VSVRDIIGDFLEGIGVDEAYRAADRLIGRLAKEPGERLGSTAVDCTGFAGSNDSELLVEVARWLKVENRVLIGLWSTGFGGLLETHLQVITEPEKEPS